MTLVYVIPQLQEGTQVAIFGTWTHLQCEHVRLYDEAKLTLFGVMNLTCFVLHAAEQGAVFRQRAKP